MTKGDIAIIVTPDDTHFDIAHYAIEHGWKKKKKQTNKQKHKTTK